VAMPLNHDEAVALAEVLHRPHSVITCPSFMGLLPSVRRRYWGLLPCQ
jgi:hypothetical protein